MKDSEIFKKLEDNNATSFEAARKCLTDEEIVIYMNENPFYGVRVELEEGDAGIIAEILHMIGDKGFSAAHASRILSTAEGLLERIAVFRF